MTNEQWLEIIEVTEDLLKKDAGVNWDILCFHLFSKKLSAVNYMDLLTEHPIISRYCYGWIPDLKKKLGL